MFVQGDNFGGMPPGHKGQIKGEQQFRCGIVIVGADEMLKFEQLRLDVTNRIPFFLGFALMRIKMGSALVQCPASVPRSAKHRFISCCAVRDAATAIRTVDGMQPEFTQGPVVIDEIGSHQAIEQGGQRARTQMRRE
jgi:hypothetical protein